MNQSKFPVSNPSPKLFVRAHGDLLIQSGEENSVTFEVPDKTSLSVQQNNDELRVTSLEDCRITTPRGTLLEIEKVDGDLEASHLIGRVVVHRVNGDCALEDVGALEIINVNGDLQIKQAAGPVNVHHVSGDFDGIEVHGTLNIDGVSGDISLDRCVLPRHCSASGDIEIVAVEAGSQPAHMNASGDVELVFPGGVNAVLVVNASGDIQIETVDQKQNIESHHAKLQLGSGGVEVVVNASGDVSISDHSGAPVKTTFRGHGAGWMHGMDAGIRAATRGAEIGARKAEETARRVEDISRRAQERVQAMMERLEINVEAGDFPFANMPSEEMGGMETMGETGGEPGQASEEEKLLILQMVAEKKITIDEAEQLLEALEK